VYGLNAFLFIEFTSSYEFLLVSSLGTAILRRTLENEEPTNDGRKLLLY